MTILRTVELPSPFQHQREVLLDAHRFKVCDWGRQSGKTLMGGIMVLDGHGPLLDGAPLFRGALHGAQGWWVTRDYPTSTKIWRELKGYLSHWGGELDKSEQERRIAFPGGGWLAIKSAHDEDSLRGETLDFVVADEVAFWRADAALALRPTLAIREGWCVQISTPNGLNHFYDEYLRGAERRDPDYRAWTLPSSANPALPAAELERLRSSLGIYGFRRECLAEFVVAEGGLFRREWFKFFSDAGTQLAPEQGAPVWKRDLAVFLTADFATTAKTYSDYTVVMVWGRCRSTGRLFLLDLWRGKLEAPAITPLLRRLVETHGVPEAPIWVEAAGPVVRVNAEARDAGLRIVELPYRAMHREKVAKAQPAAAAVEAGRVLLPRGATWVPEFLAECAAFPDAAHHDDQVDALGHAVFASPAPPTTPTRRPDGARGAPGDVRRGEDDRDNHDEERGTPWLIGR